MKNMIKIIRHYLLVTVGVTLLLLSINFIVILFWTSSVIPHVTSTKVLETLSDELILENNTFHLSEAASKLITDDFAWAMLLNDSGDVIWSQNLPSDIPLSYTASQIASFSKWYLMDYPVHVWTHPQGLFVLAQPQNSSWKLQLELPMEVCKNAPTWLLIFMISNIIGAILLCFLLGLRFFRALKEVISGVEDLADKKPVQLRTKGLLKDLATNLNTTSKELIRQQKLIEKRDTARNNWITGVSHDIRTPLSMILGYSSTLENDATFPSEYRKQFMIIRTQSERIKALVDDLNLATKLEYDMQPLRVEPFYLSALLRTVVVDYLNTLCDGKYAITLHIADSSQDFILKADTTLMERALRNIINNCMRHNPDGCEIFVTLEERNRHQTLEVKDIGIGFNPSTLDKLNHTDEMPTGVNHGLGLFIVKQIAFVSGATIYYDNWEKGSCITLTF